MTLGDEIKEKILLFPEPPQIISDWKCIADEISESFEWIGSKIDWKKTGNHQHMDLHGDYDCWVKMISSFIHKKGIHSEISGSASIYYINDSSLDYAILINSGQFYFFLDMAITNIPQHHYFFNRDRKWCMTIASEGSFDFGFSTSDSGDDKIRNPLSNTNKKCGK